VSVHFYHGLWNEKLLCGRQNNVPIPENVMILIPKTCEYVAIQGNRYTVNIVKLKDSRRGDSTGLIG
jgi:hypothetical protein